MSRNKIVFIVLAAVVAGGLFGGVPTGAQNDSSDTAAWESWDTPDVVSYALGVRTDADRRRLLDAQVDATNQMRDLATREGEAAVEASPVREARAEFGRAVDDLYAAAAVTAEAKEGRTAWRECMATAGFAFDSPLALEDAIGQAALEANDALRPELESNPLGPAIAANDRCHASTIHILNPALRRLYPDWYEEHKAVIGEYVSQLGL